MQHSFTLFYGRLTSEEKHNRNKKYNNDKKNSRRLKVFVWKPGISEQLNLFMTAELLCSRIFDRFSPKKVTSVTISKKIEKMFLVLSLHQ